MTTINEEQFDPTAFTEINQYETFDDLVKQFVTQRIDLTQPIMINNVPYKFHQSTDLPFIDYIRGKKAAVVFSTTRTKKQQAVDAGMNEMLIFVWKPLGANILTPIGIIPTSSSRGFQFLVREQVKPANQPDLNIIGDVLEIAIVKPAGLSFNPPLKGKVDTGASMCSLHVDNWKDRGSDIDFTSSALADGRIFTVPKDTMMSIKSAEDTEYRPVITMSFKINGMVIQDIQVNLNNRAKMKYPLLIGQNALEKGKFLIDPSKSAERYESDQLNWDEIHQLIEQFDFDEQTKPYQVEIQYNKLLNLKATFEEILHIDHK